MSFRGRSPFFGMFLCPARRVDSQARVALALAAEPFRMAMQTAGTRALCHADRWRGGRARAATLGMDGMILLGALLVPPRESR